MSYNYHEILSWQSGLPYDNTSFSIGESPKGGENGGNRYEGGTLNSIVEEIRDENEYYIIKLSNGEQIKISSSIPSFVQRVSANKYARGFGSFDE
ncbi:hypothetical protein [Listeria ilorinensis]|uniref:hypothetical protein n=1 Tax=Listeria ilorinensis TaxID=2867439 RepID=UPI001EF65477|nr:hypothetical protein [Listeria ilorinensis]